MGGSYLSRPVKETVSELKSNDELSYGASSMQGWRVRQEDAHNCILDFDDDVSFFAVYDGHGGSEVAVYTSQELPKFLKTTEKYKSGLYKEALIDAFLGFDDTIPSEEVLDKLKDIRDQELMDSRAKSQERRDRLRSSTGVSIDEAEEEEEEEEIDEESEDDEEDEFESTEVLLREACRPVEEVVAAYKQGTSVSSSFDGAGSSSSSAGCSSSFLGESSSSFVDSGAGSSSAGSSSTAGSSSAGPSSSGSSSFGVGATCSSQSSSSRSAASSSKSSKDENLANGSVGEQALVNGVLSNGDLSDELKEEKLPKRIPKGPAITINDQPGTSPKKKKLTSLDLDDSTVVKNFIANDEISESDDDDSEDETFELSNNLDNDEENDDDDDDDEDDADDEDDSDSETRKAEFVLNRDSLVQQLAKHLRQNHGIIVADSDDSEEDDADESVGEEDESTNEAKSGEEEEDEESIEEEDVTEEESDNDEESIDLFSDGEQPGVDSGCTAVVALVKGDNLYVANAGDSRCVLCKNGIAVEMSEDHKPEDELECARVEKAGGRVYGGRVDGGLNLSRAIGDHRYKKNTELPNTEQMITALPDVRVAKLEPDVEFIVLACDGIWNSLSSQDVVNFIRPRIKSNKSLSEICEELFHECLAPNTMCDGTGCDNMTCIIVKPHHGAAADDSASNVANSESQTSNSVDGASSATEKDAPSDAPSSEPAQNAASKNHLADKPLAETTSESAATVDISMEEGVACSRNLKRPNDSTNDDVDDVAHKKRCKTDDVPVDDSSCVDTTSV